MQYRTFLKTGEKISLLGIGVMRFPENADGSVNEKKAVQILRAAIDGGVNYIDTAYDYHDGKSEVVTGKALKDGYREKVLLADKMPLWDVEDEAELTAIFDEQLKRLDVQTIDMYMVHAMDESAWEKVQRFHVVDFMEKKRAEGKIKHIGFSFHDSLDFFKEMIDVYPWDFCQIQLNYMDMEYQAGVAGLKYAAEKAVPVIVMEPLRGGLLTDRIPANIQKIWSQAKTQRTPAEWALRWVANFPEVLTILSGVSTMPQLTENIKILSDAMPGSMTKQEHSLIQQVSDAYNTMLQYACTECGYCMPCPREVEISDVLSYYNDWFIYEQNPKIKEVFDEYLSEENRPSLCDGCKSCEERCPQHLPIAEVMKKAAALFE